MARPEKKTPFRYAFPHGKIVLHSEKRDDRKKYEEIKTPLGIFCEKHVVILP